MTAKPPPIPHHPFRFTREQYYELTAAGFFDNVPVELIFGRVFEMAPDGETQTASRRKVIEELQRSFGSAARVGRATSVCLPDSAPRPDATVLASALENDVANLTSALLVVEVADATLSYDLTTKAELYATANVPEYWVLDLEHRQLIVFRDPQSLPLPPDLAATAYRTRLTFLPTDRVSPLAAPSASILVSDLLP